MRKLWALLFLTIPVAGVALFVMAPSLGWWLPKDVSTHGADIDRLFWIILGITGVTFIATELVLVYFLFRYAGKEGGKGYYVHGNHKAEVLWTVIPAAILAYIALAQYGTWQDVKFTSNFPKEPPLARVLAGQFEWRIFYAGEDRKLDTADDVVVVNDFHVPVNTPIVIHLKSRDVLHSFFLPNLRVKQDAVPGMTIPIWFQATESGQFDLVCAELCGWGHYKMKGRLTVEAKAAFDAWLKNKKKEQEESQ